MKRKQKDWTTNPKTGRANDSVRFNELAGVVERLIRGEAFALIAGRADGTARLIMANLAHVQGMAPGPRKPVRRSVRPGVYEKVVR